MLVPPAAGGSGSVLSPTLNGSSTMWNAVVPVCSPHDRRMAPDTVVPAVTLRAGPAAQAAVRVRPLRLSTCCRGGPGAHDERDFLHAAVVHLARVRHRGQRRLHDVLAGERIQPHEVGVDCAARDLGPCHVARADVLGAHRVGVDVLCPHGCARDVVLLHAGPTGERGGRAGQRDTQSYERDDHCRRRPPPEDAAHWKISLLRVQDRRGGGDASGLS